MENTTNLEANKTVGCLHLSVFDQALDPKLEFLTDDEL